MDIVNSDFAYNATIKFAEIHDSSIRASLPEVTDIAVNSRRFNSYVECVLSARSFMEDIVNNANTDEEKLALSAEINPLYTGLETRSRDWNEDELARLWIFEASQRNALNIQAVGQARIFAFQKLDSDTRLSN